MAGIVHILRREGLTTAQIAEVVDVSEQRLAKLEANP
jgi:transcriptional regulator with XRE-family HTH domain